MVAATPPAPSAEATSASPAEAFWRGLARGELLAQICRSCRQRCFPARSRCPDCLSADLDELPLSGRGDLHSWTLVRRGGREMETPYVLGLIDLAEGLGRLVAPIAGVEGAAAEVLLRIGMPVRVGCRRDAAGAVRYCLRLD
mgnify:CR=1 FL=1